MNQQRGGISIDTGGNPLANLATLLGGIAAVVLAVALWQAATGLQIFLIATGCGLGGGALCRGISWMIWAEHRGQAERTRAQGDAQAALIQADAARRLADANAHATLMAVRRGASVERAGYRLLEHRRD